MSSSLQIFNRTLIRRFFLLNIIFILTLSQCMPFFRFTHEKTQNESFTNYDIEQSIDIDPQLKDLLFDSQQQEKVINVIVSTNVLIADNLYNQIRKLQGLEIQKFYSEFSLFRVSGKVKYISNLLGLGAIRGIYLDAEEIINTREDEWRYLASSNADPYKNVSETIDSNNLPSKINSSKLGNGKNVVMAMLSSGLDILGQINGELDDLDDNETTIDPKILGSVSMVPYEPFYHVDFHGSGTYHSGVAVGTEGRNSTYRGIAPNAHLLNVKVIDSFGLTYSSFVISGLEWAIQHDADIICLPWTFPGFYNDPISIAINQIVDRGVIVVTPAGDDGPSYTSVLTPGQSMKSITVGAYNHYNGSIASFSGRGPTYDLRTSPDLIAPGVNIAGPLVSIDPNATQTDSLLFSDINLTLPRIVSEIGGLGRPINENFTILSSTTSSTAIVAGVCALLVSLFPLATPETIKIALMKTANKLLPNNQASGAGLINVTAAAFWLDNYYDSSKLIGNRVFHQSLYPGMITNLDYRGIGGDIPEDVNQTNQNIYIPTSSRAMMSGMFIGNNNSLDNITNLEIHLPLNQFSISYNKTGYLFSELEVYKELEVITGYGGFDPADYTRWGSILGINEELFIVVIIETWSYTFNGIISGNPNYTDRVYGFRYNFHILNEGNKIYQNLTIHSFFKADLYLNEFNITDITNISDVLNASYDDIIQYNKTDRLIYAIDQYNEGTEPTNEYTSYCINSSSHPLNQWEINSSDVLFNKLLEKDFNLSDKNESLNTVSNKDLAFSQSWLIEQSLKPKESTNFSGIFSIGKGNSSFNCYTNMKHSLSLIQTNVTNPQVKDMAIIRAKSERMSEINEKIHIQSFIINMGNTRINSTEFWFIANLTSQGSQINLYSSINLINNWSVMEILNFTIRWTPIQTGSILYNFIIGGIILLPSLDDALNNNYLSRRIFVFNPVIFHNNLKEFVYISPQEFPFDPFILKHPGDLAALNLSVISPIGLDSIYIKYEEEAKNIIIANRKSWLHTDTYSKIPLIFIIPMFFKPNIYLLNFEVHINNNFSKIIPIQFTLEDCKGRIMFDGIHNKIRRDLNLVNASISGLKLNTILKERLDYIFGDFFTFRKLFSDITPKGMAMTQIVPNLNLTDLLRTQADINTFQSGLSSEMGEDYSFALNYIFKGENFFEFSDNLTTNKYSYDLIKFFDSLVLLDPEKPFLSEEISAFERYIELGGNIIIFCENSSENDLVSINTLLNITDLRIQNQTLGKTNFTFEEFDGKEYNITMMDPMIINKTDENNDHIQMMNDYLSIAQIGDGNLVVVGDSDLIGEDLINNRDNSQFIQFLIHSSMNHSLNIRVNSLSQNIKQEEKAYVYLNLLNKSQQYLIESDFLNVMGFTTNTNEMINASLFGFNLPFLPFLRTNSTAFYGYYDPQWYKAEIDEVHLTVYVDTPSTLSETFTLTISISWGEKIVEPRQFTPRSSPYPDLIDILFLTLLICNIGVIWAYSAEKWRSRHKFVEINKEKQNMLKNYFSSLKSEIQHIENAIKSEKLYDVQKLRYILRHKKEIKQKLKELEKIAAELGER